MPTNKTKPLPKAPAKEGPGEAKAALPTASPQSIRIVDTPAIAEQFANYVLDVFLVSGHTVSMTFGAKRTFREATLGDRETVIAVNARLTVDLPAAEALRNALNRVLAMAKQPTSGVN